MAGQALTSRERAVLRDVAVAAAGGGPLAERFARCAGMLGEVAGLGFLALFMREGTGETVRAAGAWPAAVEPAVPGRVVPAATVGLALEGGLAAGEAFLTDGDGAPAAAAWLRTAGYGAGWASPLFERGDLVGFLIAGWRARERPTERACTLLREASTLLAAAAARERELQAAKVAAARSRAAGELAARLTRGESFETLFAALAELLPEALPVDYLGLMVRGPAGFALAGEFPPGVHTGAPPSAEGDAFIDAMARGGDTLQFRPELGASPSDALALRGYGRAAVAVLREERQAAGLLVVARRGTARFDPGEMAFLELLRALLSQAMTAQARRRRDEGERARAKVLNDLAAHLSVGTPLAAVFDELRERLPAALAFDWVALAAVTPDGDALEVVGAAPPGRLRAGMTFPAATAPSLTLPFDADGLYEYEPAKARTAFGRMVGEAGYRRAIVARLYDGNRLVGSLNLARKVDAPFAPDERRFLATLAPLLGLAVGNRRRLQDATRAAERLRVLNELALLLNRGEGPEAFFEALATRLTGVVEFDGLSLWTYVDEEHLRVVDSLRRRSTGPGYTARRDSFGIMFAELGRATVLEAPVEEFSGPMAEKNREAGVKRVAAVALRHEGRDEGLLLMSRMHERPFDAEEVAHLESVAALVAQALANHRKVREQIGEAVRRQALSELTALLEGGEDVRDHFEALSRILLQAVGFDLLSITTRDPVTGAYVPVRSRPLDIDADPDFREEGIRQTVEAGGVVQYRTDRNPNRVPQALARAGYRRAATAVISSSEGHEGLLTIGRLEDERFGTEELEFIRLVAALLGQATANQRARLRRERQEQFERVLAEVALFVNDGAPIASHFERLSRLLLGLAGVDGVALAVRVGEDAYACWRTGRADVLPVDPAEVERLEASGQRSVQFDTGDANADTAVVREMREDGIARVVATLLRAGEQAVGVLALGRRQARPFDADEQRFAELLGTLVAYAVANRQRLELSIIEAEEQAVLAAAASAAARETDPLSIARELQRVVGRQIPAAYVAFGFLEGERVLFPNRAGEPTAMPLGASFREAMETGVAVVPPVARRTSPGSALPELDALGIQAHIVALASSAGTPVGLLVIGSRDPNFEPDAREVEIVRLIADIVGPAMANARAMERERLEAEDQRLLAEVAAVAAREGSPDAMTVALQRPLRRLVPLPIVAFGLKDGDRILYPLGDGTVFEAAVDAYAREAEERGQTHADRLPDDLDERSPLWRMGARAASTTAARAGGRTIGFLVVASRDPDYVFGERALRLLRLIAQIVGPAMENARAAEQARQDAEEQRFLSDIAAVATRAETEDELVRQLGQEFRWLVPAARVDLLLFDEEGNLVSAVMPSVRLPVGFDFPDAKAPAPVVREPDEAVTAASRERQRELGIVRSVTTRLASRGTTLGVLWVGTSDPEFHFLPRHLRVIKLMADILGPAVANLRERRRRIEEAEEQRFLADAASAAARATGDREFLAGLTATFARLVPNAIVGFYYADGDRLTEPVSGTVVPLGPAVRRAIAAGQAVDSLETPDILPENRARIAASGLRTWVTTAAASEGETIGVLVVGTPEEGYAFSERDLRLCRLVADIAGPAMANFRERRRRMEEAEDERIVASVAAAAAAARSVEEVVNYLPAVLGERIPGAFAMYGFVQGDAIAYRVTDPQAREVIGQEELVMRFSPVGREALATGQGVGDLAPYRAQFYGELGLCAYALSSYHSAGGVSGMLMVASRDPSYRFAPRELALLRRVTRVVGPVIESVTAQAERDRQAEEQRILAEASAAAATASGPMAILQAVVPVLERFVPSAFAAYGRFVGDELVWPHPLGGEFRLPVLPHEDDARRTGQVVVPGTAIPASHFGPSFGFSVVCYTASYSAGEPTGLLLVASRQPGHTFGARDLDLIRRIAQVVGPALEANIAAQDRMRQAATYGLILGSLSEAVILSDRTGRTVFANQLGREIVQALAVDDVAAGMDGVLQRMPEELREPFRRAFDDGIRGSGRAAVTVSGELRWFDCEFVPIADPQVRLLTVAADVTEEVRRAEAEAANRARMEQASRLAALGELIGGVAHELNNPLTAILGFAEVLAYSDQTGQFSEELGIIQKEALRARNIVRDLLFIARPGEVEHGPVSVSEVVGHVARLRERAWQQAAIEVALRVDEGLEVWGNEHQLTQVVLNLVTNAEHALEGRPVRRIVIEGSRDEAGQVRLAVSDTGAGMDEATRARIFEPFFTTKQGSGTGLGLSLSYSIVRSHSGTIDCLSAPGTGTTFVITLPAPPREPAVAEAGAAPVPARQATVLVIDDEPSLRKVCRRLVESLGHRCIDAENSEQALALVADSEPDIILCDYRLASGTADAVFAGLEARFPHLIPRAIIATGATTDAGVVALVERYGLELLAKPYGVEDLARIFRERVGEEGTDAGGAPQAGSSG
ncbi:GAF domain-containing protein [Tepidiforma sp.]|uniref:GAF domain-containing protein n=1 Tax=Tepidiforma sp. TaxID=2682230 RepID=UPI002ADE6204|nr:GAF domain-containing protein [Tepidiforma sp.]